MNKTKASLSPRNPKLAKVLRTAAEAVKAFTDIAENRDHQRREAARKRAQASAEAAVECLKRHMKDNPPPADSGLWHLADGLNMGLCTESFQKHLLRWAEYFGAPPPLTETERQAIAYIEANPGATSDAISRYCGVEPGTFRNMVRRLKRLAGITSRRGCTGGYWPPAE